MNVRWSIVILLVGIGMSFCPAGEFPAPARLREPQLHVKRLVVPNFGDNEIVRLLGGLLNDEDELVRERAAADLGDTHNPAAVAVLRRALADRSSVVRCAAVASSAEIGGSEGAALVREALEKNDPSLLRAALQCAQRMKLTAAKDRIAALLEREEPDLRVEAVSVLTSLNQPAPIAALDRMLKARNVQEPLRAAQNAVLLSTAPELVAPLKGLTDEGRPPAVRAAAIEALGVLDFEDSGSSIIAAAQAPDALIRRAAVRVFQRRGMSEAVLPMLDDPTALVRLAAVRAAGTLKIESAVKKLTEILLSAPDDLTHQAAHEALRRIAGPAVESSVAAVLPSLTDDLERNQKSAGKIAGKISALSKSFLNPEKLPPEKQKELDALNAQKDQLNKNVSLGERNLASCCRLLGLLKSHAGYRHLLRIPGRLRIDSPVLGEAALALGRIGDERAVAPLRAVLEKCRQQAGPYLAAMMSMSPPPPFSQEVTGKVVQALVMLNDQKSLDTMLALATIQVSMVRLSEVAEYVVRYAPALAGDADSKKIEQLVLTILTDETFELTAQWYACKTAGTYKLSAALPELKDILNEQRPCLSSMVIAAWAIQEITGQTPSIPQPRLRQGDWILRKYVRREE